MSQKHVWISLCVGLTLLGGTSPTFAALWDQQCQVAIEKIQGLQKEIVVKKQEVDVARVVAALPRDFVSDDFHVAKRSTDWAPSVKELKALFQNMEFAVSEFSTLCLKRNGFSE